MTQGFLPSVSHAHRKKRKLEVEKWELCGFWRVSVLQCVLVWGALAERAGGGQLALVEGMGLDPSSPSQLGWWRAVRHPPRLK